MSLVYKYKIISLLILMSQLISFSANAQILTATDFITGIPGSADVNSIVISPDGLNLYAHSNQFGTFTGFSINQQNGRLAVINVIDVEPTIGVLFGRLIISSDGRFIYADLPSTQGPGSQLALFSRDTSTGVIELVDTNITGLPVDVRERDATISPNGQFLYLTTNLEDLLLVFSINDDGSLELIQSVIGDRVSITAISPDGRHLYVSGADGQVLYNIDPINGSLTFVGNSGFNAQQRFDGFSQDGNIMFAISSTPGSPSFTFAAFLNRDIQTGLLTSGAFIDILPGGGPFAVDLLTPINNGRLQVVVSPHSIIRFIPENEASFTLPPSQIVDDISIPGTRFVIAQAATPDDRFLYRTLSEGITVFSINTRGIGDIPEVPTLNAMGLILLVLVLLLGGRLLNKALYFK